MPRGPDTAALMLHQARRASEQIEAKVKTVAMMLGAERFTERRGAATVVVNGRGQVVSVGVDGDTDLSECLMGALLAAVADANAKAAAVYERHQLELRTM